MSKNALYGLLIALLLPLTGYFIVKKISDNTVTVPGHFIYDSVVTRTIDGKQKSDTVWHKLPEFNFTNQLGKKVSLKELGDKVLVADFFFTHCPTICPRMTVNMKQLQDGIINKEKVGEKQADFVHYLSFSVDPERDSIPELKKWADRFQINPEQWWLLTGSKKEIYDLSIEHMKLGLIDGEGIDTGFLHTDRFVLIDKKRNIRGYYHGLDSADIRRLAHDIILLSLEKDPGKKSFFAGKLELIAIVFFLTLMGIVIFLYLLKKDKKHHGIESN